MAHELYVDATGKTSMAFVGDTPWHGTGNRLTEGAPLEVWAKEAGLNFHINEADVEFNTGKDVDMQTFPSRKVLYRDDTLAPLSVVGSRYRVVQPLDVLEFFRNLTEKHSWALEAAGVLFQGAKYWALARTGNEVRIMGQDLLQDFVLLATSCDGTLRTIAKRTSVRVVCNNTLSMSLANKNELGVRVSHSSMFDVNAVQSELGLTDSWAEFADKVDALAKRKVTNREAVDFVISLFGDKTKPVDEQPAIQTIAKVLQLFDGGGRGSDLVSAKGTAFGMVNAVTEYIDWHKGKDQSRRLDNAWFLGGADLKERAFNKALELLAA